MNKKTLSEVEVAGQRVLVRVDFNVPLAGGKVLDDSRIKGVLPTIHYLVERKARVILLTHLGRPGGKVNPDFSVRPLTETISQLLGREVGFAGDCGGPLAKSFIRKMRGGQIVLLENVRFYPGEEKNDPSFAESLARLADLYVNDSFGSSHRSHASTAGVAQYIPGVAGFLLEKELAALSQLAAKPARPFLIILGGAKARDKIPVVKNLLDKVDSILLGGVMANTFLTSQEYDLAQSKVEKESLSLARNILQECSASGIKTLLPSDLVVADRYDGQANTRVVGLNMVPPGWMALDIGPATVQAFAEEMARARTIFWNGPLGVYEMDKFSQGTIQVAEAMAQTNAKTVIGGGDVVAAVEKAGVSARISHISTGGGASLEFLSGRKLPGIEVLEEKSRG